MPLPGATVWATGQPQQIAVTNAGGDFTLVLPDNQAVVLSCAFQGKKLEQVALPRPQDKVDFYVGLQPAGRARR